MLSNEPVLAHFTTAEIDAAIQALPELGKTRLRKIAQTLAGIYPMEAEDLLHEAYCRALDGRRRCPCNVNLIKFLAEAMQSIASDSLKAAKRRPPELRLVTDSGDEDGEEALDPPDDRPSIEDQLVFEQETSRIKSAILGLFKDDPIAEIIVEGDMEEMDGEELRLLTELDKTAFASKRRLIRRRIAKAFPKGWIP